MKRRRRRVLGLAVAVLVLASCDPMATTDADRARPDPTLHTHAVLPSTPTAEGLAYIQAMGEVHRVADAQQGAQRVAALRAGLAIPVPKGLGEADVLRLDVAARLGETLMESGEGALVAREILEPMLATDRSLPVDRASARALVVLGDAARQTGDDALAAGSYARAISVMSLLRQELEP